MSDKKLKIYIDGGSRGNPGPGACATVILDENGAVLKEEGKYLGRCTNNIAEYNGLILALAKALELHGSELQVYSDSELLVKQFSGEYRIKDPALAVLMSEIRKAVSSFASVKLSHIPRKNNSHADRLVNLVLDQKA